MPNKNTILLLISLSIALSVIFTFLSHPLSILIVIITQTLIMVILSGIFNISYWFSYILFLIFLGGMLVLFIYIASLASNEIFFKTSLINIVKLLLLPFFLSMVILYSSKNLNFYPLMPQSIDINLAINKFYLHNYPITLLVILYLLVTLFAVVKITKFNKGPLRSSK
uniref:NADH-ubiquinone oxidoreductase chain 6 n=1 Tax=Scutigera coleoptrata TaxID=29022 RepID=Q70XS0_SCUCO|nr:NADH dehydrogenase subunit 6 [Scutigera coleoptrata]CAE01479.1 NADH dehydrogenase subunit 6 [Scutigera coleoptrata]